MNKMPASDSGAFEGFRAEEIYYLVPFILSLFVALCCIAEHFLLAQQTPARFT